MGLLAVGSKAPQFTTTDQHGNVIDSSALSGSSWVIYFYPKDNTPGCTAQACSLRDDHAALSGLGVRVFGVSADSLASHKKFADKFELPFSLLLDEDRAIIEAFGVWGPKQFMGKKYDGIHRTTFIVGPDQTITHVIEKPNTKAHGQEIQQILASNQ